MNIAGFKRVGKWPLDKLVDAIVYLCDLLLRFLNSRGWSPKLIVKRKTELNTGGNKICRLEWGHGK